MMTIRFFEYFGGHIFIFGHFINVQFSKQPINNDFFPKSYWFSYLKKHICIFIGLEGFSNNFRILLHNLIYGYHHKVSRYFYIHGVEIFLFNRRFCCSIIKLALHFLEWYHKLLRTEYSLLQISQIYFIGDFRVQLYWTNVYIYIERKNLLV